MKKGWKECNLEDHINLIDYRGRTPIKTNSGVRLITAKNVKLGYLQLEPQEFINSNDYKSWMTRGIPNFGDVIFTTEAPLGNVAQIDSDEKLAFAQRIIVMQPKKNEIDQTFLKYMLLSPIVRQRILSKGTGATVQGIKSSLLKKIKISYPISIPEQQRIVSLLDETFAAIEQAKANVERNLQNAKELFQSELNSIFSQKGEGWVEKKLGEIIKYDKNQKNHTNLPYIGLENIESNTGRFIGNLEPQEVKSATFHFTNKHVLYGRLRPYLNKVLIPNFEGHCSTEIFPILVKDIIMREFLFYWLISSNTVTKIDSTWTGARMPRADMNQVLNFEFSYPKIDIQHQIVERLDALSRETKKLESKYQAKLAALEELKKSVLEKAFRGEI